MKLSEQIAFMRELAALFAKYPNVGISGDAQGEGGLTITFPGAVLDISNEECGFLPEVLDGKADALADTAGTP